MVVEDQSESYRTKELDLESRSWKLHLRKSIENDFLKKIIELANEEFGTDLKKNLETKP